MASTGVSLAERFEAEPNALNAVRLALAITVVAWHARLLQGLPDLWAPAAQLLEQLPVDAFFALSGFLIVRSWIRRPKVIDFALSRTLRLFPGLWICLLVSAFLIVPIALAISGRPPVTVAAQLNYVLGNVSSVDWLWHRGIEHATIGNPKYVLNVSLWSLRWELACYLGVMVLGLLRLLRIRVVVWIIAVAWALAVSLMLLQVPDDFVFGIWPAPRLVLMFGFGAMLFLAGDRIAFSSSWAAVSAVWVAAAAFTPDYRVFAAPALAYLILWVGMTLGRFPSLRLQNDLSYGVYIYGAPVQQGLLIAGITLSWEAFTAVSLLFVLPMAAASWLGVESIALRLKRRRRNHVVVDPPVNAMS